MKILITIFLLVASSLHADSDLSQLMSRLQKKYDALQTLKANFVQTYQSSRFSDSLTEKGVVYFQKGGLMRWEYQEPEKKIFASDGRFYYYYVVEDKQVIKAEPDHGSDQRSPTLFLAGRGNFIKDFRAEWADPRPGSHLVKLTPVRTQPDFEHMIVEIDPVRAVIVRLLVVDSYGNKTEYRFNQIQENVPLSPSFFAFKPPPGTDVILQRPETE